MAKSSRQSALFGINDWKRFYQTYNQADFQSYDYETLRKAFIDYLQTYYPENFNDYTESSEFIALLDVIAFMGQGLAFRDDLNARENFIDTAERRDSVIKLANLVSYTPKRNLAGQGYLKVTSLATTQNITDINGANLGNQTILWNDPANPNWLEQMNSIWNACFINAQRIGNPGNTQDILGVTTSEYSIQIAPNALPVVPFNATVNGVNMNFELVSGTSVDKSYVYEVPPAPNGKLNVLYRNDKLGFGSPNTGFFFYFKQGSLVNYDFTLQQQISNQVIPIGNIQGINNTDTWLYQFNSDGSRTQWKQVDNIYSDAYLQNASSNKTIFAVNSGFNDSVSYVFGDNVFSKIPVGNFRAYVRSGNALTYTIDPTALSGVSVSISYIDRTGKNQLLTIGLSLEAVVNNAQARESLADIKQRAPTRYYTQNRMVNGEDYSNFPYSLYSSIIKSKAINRSSVGISKNLDLLDPTLKYSSTDSYANDGAIYMDDAQGNLTLSVNTTSDIISFFTNELAAALAQNNSNQYYTQYYPRYQALAPTPFTDGSYYWATSTVDTSAETGYFYTLIGNVKSPTSIGTFATTNIKYITNGAMLKFAAPTGQYFDSQNRLQPGIPGPGDTSYIWTTVLNVVGDGSNNGNGSFANGQGPVKVYGYVPDGAILDTVIPVFDNAIPTTLLQEAIIRMELNQNFTLVFNNSLLINQQRWFISTYDDSNYYVKFTSAGNGRYSVVYRKLIYYFGSVADVRFAPPANQVIYDPYSGKIVQDYVNVLGINPQPNSVYPLGKDYKVNIIDQPTLPDGYINEFSVQVAATDENNQQIITNPDYFNEVSGYVNGATNIGIYTFFETVQDPINLTRNYIVPSSTIVYAYPTLPQIEQVKYDYPVEQVYYAFDENIFYKSVQDPNSLTPSYSMIVQPQYSMKPGRQGIKFQYRHNSDNTTRIDPVTTNIIDLYLVTQSYYTAYTNYIQDTTGTVPKPNVPTINQLSQDYGDINNYKMLSDSVVLNSVVFKPLFGPKADEALRATIKVIKSSTTSASDSEIRSAVLTAMNTYFNVNNWDFGDTFYFSELSAYLHAQCGDLISSAVLVPNNPELPFGTLYEIKCLPYEIFVNAATANDVLVIPALTPSELQVR